MQAEVYKIKEYHTLYPMASAKEIALAIGTNLDTVKTSIDIEQGCCIVCGEWSGLLLDGICNNWTCRRLIKK